MPLWFIEHMKKSIIVGTAGHIDHGKTALVKALTGVDADRLPEEKERGITIDIGFAHWELLGHDVSFVDVPGHERFIKNMLAGVGGIDLLMLVVAGDESVMPQTREHFDICRLLNIPAGLVVITKKDLVDDATVGLVRQDIASLVKGSFLDGAPLYAVSARTGDGIEELKQGLGQAIDKISQRPSAGIFRLPIDRVFTLKGHGTVVTGTIISGSVRKETAAEILPSARNVKIRSVHAHNAPVEQAVAGQRTAVNLQGIEKDHIVRGDILTEQDVFQPTSLLDVKLSLLESAAPLVHNETLRFHHFTNDLLVRVTLLGTESLTAGQSGFAQLRLQRPIHAFHGDRFILRRHSPLVTAGGGIILDHMPARRISRTDAASLDRLKRLDTASPAERLALAVDQRSFLGADEKYLRAKMGMHAAQLRPLIGPPVERLRETPMLLISSSVQQKWIDKLLQTLSEFHQRNQLLPGISKEQLRSRTFPKVPSEVFVALLERAVDLKKVSVDRETVAVAGRKVALTEQQGSLAVRTEALFEKFGLEFPGMEDLAKQLHENPTAVKNILYVLMREGKLIKITEDYFLASKLWEQLKLKIRELKLVQKTFSVPDFKAKFGVSRKYAIPLLELLDRQGVTRRSGNERIIL